MYEDDLKEAIRREPFVPVRITLSNGKAYDVTHPDGILVNRRVAAVAVGETIAVISTLLMTDVTPISAATS